MKNRILLIFQGKTPNFFIQKRIFRVNFLHILDVFFLQADDFLCNGSSIPSPFHTHNCSFAMFSCFSREKLPNFLIQKRIFSQISAYFRYGFFLQADGFLCNGSSIPSPFHTHNCSFGMFSCFSREKLPNFLIQKRILRVNFLHISDLFSSYKQMVFSAIEARFRRILMRTIAILPGFSTFSNNSRTRLRYK